MALHNTFVHNRKLSELRFLLVQKHYQTQPGQLPWSIVGCSPLDSFLGGKIAAGSVNLGYPAFTPTVTRRICYRGGVELLIAIRIDEIVETDTA